LVETVAELRKRRIKTSRSSLWRFLDRHNITLKKRMARPVRKWFSTPWSNQSASTYPVSGSILPAKMEIRAS
jgi:hypothetical protein